MAYDTNNIFARILRGEIPNKTVTETAHTLAFHDINPHAPIHILVIPKGAYVTAGDFYTNATDAEIADFSRVVANIIAEQKLEDTGYRLIANAGQNGGQEVPHYHMHILGGRALGRMVAKAD